MRRVKKPENIGEGITFEPPPRNGSSRFPAPVIKRNGDDVEWLSRDKWNEEKRKKAEELRKLPYQEYLQTEHWQQKRRFALSRSNHRCMICYSDGTLNVHHRTYERLGDEMPSDVIALCEKCHGIFHDKLPKPETYTPTEKRNGTIKAVALNEDDLPVFAKYLKRAYDEFVNVGFTAEQAFILTTNFKVSL